MEAQQSDCAQYSSQTFFVDVGPFISSSVDTELRPNCDIGESLLWTEARDRSQGWI